MGKDINILIVEDEERIRKMLKLFLEKEKYLVYEAENGIEALNMLNSQKFSLIILDIMMPQMDGWETCQRIKEKYDVPIVMLTARGDESDRILGFELGVDDYVVKPFSPIELLLRVKALLRRTLPADSPNVQENITAQELQIIPNSRTVLIDGQELYLTPLEYELLYFLASNQGLVFTREQLLDKVWGYDFFGELRTVDTHVKRVREKLVKVSPKVADYIKTVWGVGYKFGVGK